jgi:acetyl-CoA carboxylase biotin carboxyl carrier protein
VAAATTGGGKALVPANPAAKSQAPLGVPHAELQDLIELLKRNNLAEVEFERQGVRIRLRRDVGPATVVTTSAAVEPATVVHDVAAKKDTAPASVPADTGGMVTITSPIVGTFYRSPSPDADPYVEEGDLVKKGQVLCIVEAMKLMNEIESEVDGKIIKILAESTKPVEYAQPLFLIDPHATA